MEVNRPITVTMSCTPQESGDGDDERLVDIEMDMHRLEEVASFRYLGSIVQGDGELCQEVTHRMQCGWSNWRRCRGILLGRRMPVKLKGRIHQQVVRLAILYAAEC